MTAREPLRPGSCVEVRRSHPGRHGGRTGRLEALDGDVALVRFGGCLRTVAVPLAALRVVLAPLPSTPKGSNR